MTFHMNSCHPLRCLLILDQCSLHLLLCWFWWQGCPKNGVCIVMLLSMRMPDMLLTNQHPYLISSLPCCADLQENVQVLNARCMCRSIIANCYAQLYPGLAPQKFRFASMQCATCYVHHLRSQALNCPALRVKICSQFTQPLCLSPSLCILTHYNRQLASDACLSIIQSTAPLKAVSERFEFARDQLLH